MRYTASVIGVALCLAAAASTATAQAVPTSGWRAEAIGMFTMVEGKYVKLAEATPWEKFSWRPVAGVRTVCEVYMHMSWANYMLSQQLGAKPPAGVDMKAVENNSLPCPDSRDKVVAAMKTSFAQFRDAIAATPDADGDKMFKLFGMDFSKRGFASFAGEHAGEHLGQSIAYARMMGITPPWSMKPTGTR